MTDTTDILLREKDLIRTELQDLKSCQVRYFTLSVTAAGILIGIGSRLIDADARGILYLAPLLVVLPCWWVFFDKASTITRIVGYLRVLEEMITGTNADNLIYYGWERSLSIFRPDEQHVQWNSKLFDIKGNFIRIWKFIPTITSKTPHLYWFISWWTFFSLAVLTITMAFFTFEKWSILMALILLCPALFSGSFTAELVSELADGKKSYDENEKFWRKLLKKPRVKINGLTMRSKRT